MKKQESNIDKLNDDTFILKKNKDFNVVFDTTLAIYNLFVEDVEKIIKKKYVEKDSFVQLIILLKKEEKTVILNKEQIELLSQWIDRICNIIIEKNNVDLKNKDLKEYFKFATQFNKSIQPLIT